MMGSVVIFMVKVENVKVYTCYCNNDVSLVSVEQY